VNREGVDAFVERHLQQVLRSYQRVEVTVVPGVTACVHTPYMMQTVSILQDEDAFARLKPRHQARLLCVKEARDAARPELRAYLRGQFYDRDGRECDTAKGRASPEDVRACLQGAVERGLVPAAEGRQHPDSRDLRDWLKRFGVGVDCSGFVQHALNGLVAASYATAGREPDGDDATGFLRAGWVYREASAARPADESRFRPVPRRSPAEARPGDVLVSHSHMRIAICATEGEARSVVLDLAESTSARGVPCGLAAEEADIGPRVIQVVYVEPGRPVGEQMPLLRLPGEDSFRADAQEAQYVLGRCCALERARASWQGRAAADGR
jgi:hypothetical protein